MQCRSDNVSTLKDETFMEDGQINMDITDFEDSDEYEDRVTTYLLSHASPDFLKRSSVGSNNGVQDLRPKAHTGKVKAKENRIVANQSSKRRRGVTSWLVTKSPSGDGVFLKGINDSCVKPLQNTDENCNSDDPLKCQLCNKQCISAQQLKEHKASHQVGSKNYFCDQCGRQFTQKMKFKYHMMRHLKVLPFGCDLCDKRFAIKSGLAAHSETHSGTLHQCNDCSAKFKLTSHLARHACNGAVKAEFICEHCSKSYGKKEELRFHLNGYSGDGHYCNACDKVCRCKNQFEEHIAAHGVSLPFACELCQRAFRYATSLKQHLTRAHYDVTMLNNPDAVECESCDSLFRSKHEMKRHCRRSHYPANRRKKGRRMTYSTQT